MRPATRHPRAGRLYWRVAVFLLAFTAILFVVASQFLIPAMEASRDASPQDKKTLVAYSRLLLAVVLFVLFVLLILTFRVGRLFQPRKAPPRSRTDYSDAWSESAKRLRLPPDDD